MQLKTNHGNVKLPAFFPDATCGFVRGIDSIDLENTKTDGLVVNVYHLLKHGLINVISDSRKFGDIHKFMNWKDPVISDSGGFQVFSLIRENPKLGNITDQGVLFQLDNEKIFLTPEECIQIQIKLGSDIVMCLDDCTAAGELITEQKESVRRTIEWAKRCKNEFNRLTNSTKSKSKNKNKPNKNKPLIFGIIQGGENKQLRKYCAQELLKIGFNGYAFGGWPVKEHKDKNGKNKTKFLRNILKFTSDQIPDNYPKYAMGVGQPEDIIECIKVGYNLFDCVLPTRNARHRSLYIWKKDIRKIKILKSKIKNINKLYETIDIDRGKYKEDKNPISQFCDCYTCKNYSRAYLRNVFMRKDSLAVRLATIHNLRFYAQLFENLRKENNIK